MAKPVTIATICGTALIGVAALALSAPMAGAQINNTPAAAAAPALSAQEAQSLLEAIASPLRSDANRARDRFRHPAETLNFFGVRPTDTVVELFPGGGWYSEILVPYIGNRGNYVAAGPFDRGLAGIRRLQTANPALYSNISLTEFPAVANSGHPVVTNGTADVVLTFRNIHNLRFAGTDQTAAAFRAMFDMLKPGGRLGIVEHRLPEDMPSTMEESSGYMKRSSVVAFAEAAGFRLVGESDINANPRDTHNWPRGVWTLPPVLRGADTDPNREQYVAVGESDRMTLLFVKPR